MDNRVSSSHFYCPDLFDESSPPLDGLPADCQSAMLSEFSPYSNYGFELLQEKNLYTHFINPHSPELPKIKEIWKNKGLEQKPVLMGGQDNQNQQNQIPKFKSDSIESTKVDVVSQIIPRYSVSQINQKHPILKADSTKITSFVFQILLGKWQIFYLIEDLLKNKQYQIKNSRVNIDHVSSTISSQLHFLIPSAYVQPDSIKIVQAEEIPIWTKHIDQGVLILAKGYDENKLEPRWLGLLHIEQETGLINDFLKILLEKVNGKLEFFLAGGNPDWPTQYLAVLNSIENYIDKEPDRFILSDATSKIFEQDALNHFVLRIGLIDWKVKTSIKYAGFDPDHNPFQILNIERFRPA